MKALTRIDRQMEKAKRDLISLQLKRTELEKAEACRKSPEYRALELKKRDVRARLHVIRVNIHKKRMSVQFKTRDIKSLHAAISNFQNEEKQKMGELSNIEAKINAFFKVRKVG
jgi:tRNA threonylcarbamoyladenosine modification (KEOPS) complex  Pcc1 subunit